MVHGLIAHVWFMPHVDINITTLTGRTALACKLNIETPLPTGTKNPEGVFSSRLFQYCVTAGPSKSVLVRLELNVRMPVVDSRAVLSSVSTNKGNAKAAAKSARMETSIINAIQHGSTILQRQSSKNWRICPGPRIKQYGISQHQFSTFRTRQSCSVLNSTLLVSLKSRFSNNKPVQLHRTARKTVPYTDGPCLRKRDVYPMNSRRRAFASGRSRAKIAATLFAGRTEV